MFLLIPSSLLWEIKVTHHIAIHTHISRFAHHFTLHTIISTSRFTLRTSHFTTSYSPNSNTDLSQWTWRSNENSQNKEQRGYAKSIPLTSSKCLAKKISTSKSPSFSSPTSSIKWLNSCSSRRFLSLGLR